MINWCLAGRAPITCGKYPPVGVVQQAAARGTRVHELCALYDMDALPDEIEAGLVGYVKAWAAFCRDYKPAWTHIEFPLYGEIDPGQPFAGTLDRIGEIDGRTRVVDIKTTASLDRPAKVALCTQIGGYEWLSGLNDIDVSYGAGMGVQLFANGNYRVHLTAKIERKYGFGSAELFYSLRKLYKITKGK